MKSGVRVRVLETGNLGTVKAVHYHYLDSKNRLEKILVCLDNGELMTYGKGEIEQMDTETENDTRVTDGKTT